MTPTWTVCAPTNRGRGTENKVPFVAAVELDENGHPQRVRLDLEGGLAGRVARNILGAGAHLVTHGLAGLAATYGAAIVTPRQPSQFSPFR